MKTFQSLLALFALAFSVQFIHAQSNSVISISTSATAVAADYDKAVTAFQAKGIWELGWSFHAMGAAQPAGLFGIGIFPTREAFDKRSEATRPVFEQAGVKPNVRVYEIHNSFMGTVPAEKPAAGIVVHFDAKGMSAAQYDQIIAELNKSGATFPPPGQISHVAYKTDDGVKVVDVWESAENFGAFGEKLMPILQSLGIDAGQPAIYSLYNYLKTNN